MNLLLSNFLNLFNLYPNGSSTMAHLIANFKRLAALIAVVLILVPSAFAQEWGAHDTTPEYACGSEIKYDAKSPVTNAQAAAQDRKNWDDCTAAYVFPSAPEIPACEAVVLASTVGKAVCDYNEYHDTQDTQLMERRANERQAAFLETTPAAKGHVTQKLRRDLVDTTRKTSWVIITPADGAVRRDQIKPACSDGLDNDGDRKIDVDDPGCHEGDDIAKPYQPTDNDEWNLVTPEQKWSFLNGVLLKEADNLCPTMIVANSLTQTYTVQYGECECTNFDVMPETTRMEVYSDVAMAQIMRKREKAEIAKDLKFTEIREALQEGATSRVIEVNEEKAPETTPDGLSVSFIETETTLTVRFPDRCEVSKKMTNDADYTGVRVIAGASGNVGGMVLGMGDHLESAPVIGAFGEVGIEFGSPEISGIVTLGGGWIGDDQCMNNGAWGTQLRVGVATNRAGHLGLYSGVRGQYTFVPSVSAEGQSAFGPNSLVGLVEAGPRLAFGQGVRHGFITVTGYGAGDQRYIDPDADGLPTPALGWDLGVSAMVGTSF